MKTSHGETGDAVNVLIQYFEEQPGTDEINLLQLRKIKEIIKVLKPKNKTKNCDLHVCSISSFV